MMSFIRGVVLFRRLTQKKSLIQDNHDVLYREIVLYKYHYLFINLHAAAAVDVVYSVDCSYGAEQDSTCLDLMTHGRQVHLQ